MFARIISPKGVQAHKVKKTEKSEYRDLRFISDELANKLGVINGHIFIYKDRVALMSFDQDQTSVIIENQALAKVQRSLFEIAWSATKE